MEKIEICSKVLENLEKKFPTILTDNDKSEVENLIDESFDMFKQKYSKDEGDFETYMINSMENDVSVSLGLEDFEITLSSEDLAEIGESDKTYMELYEEKYKNIEKTISMGSGPLSSEEKDILAAKNIPLIHSIVKRFANTGIEYTELLSAGYVGYAKALKTYQKGKNVKFSTYAYRCIKNEILYFLRREKRHKDNDVSLYKPMSTDKNGNVMTVDSTISSEDMGEKSLEEKIETNMTIEIMLEIIEEYLSETEAFIIKARYGIGFPKQKTQKEIADEIGMSQANISKLEKGILDKVKKIMGSKYKIKDV